MKANWNKIKSASTAFAKNEGAGKPAKSRKSPSGFGDSGKGGKGMKMKRSKKC